MWKDAVLAVLEKNTDQVECEINSQEAVANISLRQSQLKRWVEDII